MDDAVAHAVVEFYDARFRPLRWLGMGSVGGFSGAAFWRVSTGVGDLCLRCWPPEHPSRERLEAIHRTLLAAARQGLHFIPAPFLYGQRDTIVESHGRLWELSPWLPGAADYHRHPSRTRLAAALQAVARFHAVCEKTEKSAPGVSPSLQERRDLLRYLIAEGADQIAGALRDGDWPEFAARGRQILTCFSGLAPGFVHRVARAADTRVSLYPCVRDIWHDHILFVGDEVTGIVDFGAMRTDNAAIDIARLLGSMVADAPDEWQWGLEAYREVRALSSLEYQLVRVADETNVLLAGMNWLRWVYVDQRSFADRAAVVARLDNILTRLRILARRHDRV